MMLKKSNHWALPRFIGICGNPLSGKSMLQKILYNNYDVQPVDDGESLRKIAMDHFGLTRKQVSTQEGKLEYVNILGRRWQVREILGKLGEYLEEMFGPHIMPFMATRNLVLTGSFSFGSVRKTQGHYYRENGGLIIALRNPDAPPSPYDFDKFDEDAVDIWIDNDGLSQGMTPDLARLDLSKKLHEALEVWFKHAARPRVFGSV